MTTYILGAGTSFHAGYPLLGDLLPELKDWVEKTNSPIVPQIQMEWLCNRIAQHFRAGRSGNLEQALTELKRAPRQTVTLADGTLFYPHLLLADLPSAIAAFFNARRAIGDAMTYRRLASNVIEPGDAIITFNYDVAIEKELAAVGKWDVGPGYGFPLFPNRNSPVQVIKLHGSTNWMPLVDGHLGFGTYNVEDLHGDRPMIPDSELQWLGFGGLKDPLLSEGKQLLGGSPRHTLLLPTLAKSFPGRMWSSLWEQAKKILNRSSRVVVIGYSLPEADERARNLILGQCHKDAKVVLRCKSRTPALVGTFNTAGFRELDADAAQDFEKWLDEEASRRSGRD